MRQRLLQHLSFAKPLRLALVLSTLLLTLPQTAWGDEVTYTFGSAPGGNGGLSYDGTKYTISSTSGGTSQGWTITNLAVNPNRIGWVASSDSLKISNITYYDSGTTDPATTVTFDLLSDFTLTGEFVRAEISYCTNKIDNRFVTISKNDDYFSSNLTRDNELLTSTPATISLSSTYAVNKYFNGNKIAFHFSFTTVSNANQNDGSFTIKSIKITTYDTYGLTVAGTVVTANNLTTFASNASFVPANNTLKLNNAAITGSIVWDSSENLTIELTGNNSIDLYNNSDSATVIKSNNKDATLTFTKTGDADLSLRHSDPYNAPSIISGFTSIDYSTAGLYMSANAPTTYITRDFTFELAQAASIKSLVSALDNSTCIHSAVITSSPTYQLWVNKIQVTSNNANDVTGAVASPTVTYNATDNILTLNRASIDGTIINNLDELTIEFIDVNTLTGTSGYINSINNSAALKLKGMTNGTVTTSTLSLDNTVGVTAISGFASVTYDGAYLTASRAARYVTGTNAGIKDVEGGIVQQVTITTAPHYPLWVRSTQVTPDNKTNVLGDQVDPTVSFDYDSRTLTLNGAFIDNSNAIESNLDKLIIKLKGNNTVQTFTYGHSAICSGIDAKLTIAKDDTETSDASLSMKTGGNPLPPIIRGFTSVDYTGLNFVSKTGTTPNGTTTTDGIFSSGTIYPLWIGGVWVTDANKSFNGTTSGTLVYDSSSNTITMTDYVSTFTTGHAIETGIDGLKVKLIGGNNAITCNDANGYAFYNGSGNTDASIQFVKDNTTSKLTLQTTPTNPFGGFANGSITYNELVYYPTGKYIAIPTAPTMTEDNDKVKMDRDNYEGGTIAIKYSIAYADGKTADITDATYSAPFAMAAPGTVTAWVEANGANSDETKGKYFGFKDAPFTMKAGDTKTVELIPAFEASDNIGYNATGTYESDATGVATFTGGTITAVAIGTATVTANIDYSSNTTPVVILNPNKKVTAVVNVGVVPSITFQDGMQYATYCNTTGTDMTVPAGLTAYAITGVNENVVTLAEVNFLPKVDGTTYVPLLLKRDDTSTTVGLALEATGGTRPTTNYLIYNNTGAAINVSDNWYVLYKNEFIKATGSIPDGKCYLDLTGVAAPAPARSLGIDSDGTTDIHLVNSEEGIVNSEVWYDLQGRRIQQPTKAGLYIKNGKKVIVNTK